MRQARLALCAALICFSLPANSDGSPTSFEVRLLRVEGAAAGVRKSAERLSEIAEKISNSNRLENLPALHTELTDLHRMVVSTRMAVDIAIQDMSNHNRTK